MAVAQVGCWMSEAEAGSISAIADEIGIGRPAACVLLVHRELRECRLEGLAGRWPYKPDKEGHRVTARIEANDLKEAFAARICEAGVASDEAAYLLFKTEIEEGWLARKLAWNRG